MQDLLASSGTDLDRRRDVQLVAPVGLAIRKQKVITDRLRSRMHDEFACSLGMSH
jgi:hypothetical protein